MTKTELIERLVAESGLDKNQVKNMIAALTTVVEQEIGGGGEVPLSTLGKFKVQKRAARTIRNPQTGQPMDVPAKTVVKFTVSKNLKEIGLNS